MSSSLTRDIPESQLSKLYIITRDDLSAAYQAVQAAHALADMILKFPKDALEWHRNSNTIVILSVSDELNLMYIEEQLTEKGIKHVSFREPDIGDELTAIALSPSEEAKEFCKPNKLALKNYAPVSKNSDNLETKPSNYKHENLLVLSPGEKR